jgi:ribonuclease G
MSKELVISASRHETRVAILEEDQLVEIYFQRSNEYSLAGSVHKGRVTRVLPGMQSAFVNLGLERDAFLYVSDFFEESGEDFDRVGPVREERPREERPREERPREERSREDRPREDRGRDDRGSFRNRPPQEAPPSGPREEAGVAAGAGVVPSVERTEPAERTEDADRDHRNRRSRRRRNRGRGFPESKYAAEPRPSSESPAPPEPTGTAMSESDDFLMLPGESLRKYARAGGGLETEEAAKDEVQSTEAEHIEPVVTETEAAEIEDLQAARAEAAEEEAADGFEEVEATLTRTVTQETVIRFEGFEAPEVTASEVLDELEPGELDEELDLLDESDPLPVTAAAESEEAVEHRSSEGVEDEAEEALASGEGSPAGAAESSAETESSSAQVRDQSGRYLQHRVQQRRPRRRRGGQGPRQHEERRPQEAASAAEPVIARPEVQTVSRPERSAATSISELLKEGQEIIVQIAKEPLGQKGARITSHIALPGRYVVYMPTVEHTGVSRKIASDDERLRLKKILQTHRQGVPGGYILRTAGEGHTEEEIAADMNFLSNLWQDMRQKADKHPAPVLLHHDLDIVQRILRDQLTDTFKSIWVDSEEIYESVLRFVQRFQPALVGRVKMYTRPESIFDAFGITAELEKALRPKVWLKSGGYIVINQTEALVAIDINTGKFVGKSNRLEDTIVKTNTEAVKEIVRQIRLRDLGGIIVVDFIDMDERKNRAKVMQTLEDAMRVDRAPYKILQFNDFGLVAITRKRVKQSLERALCAPCPYCDGAGYVKSVQTTITEIVQEAHKIRRAVEDSKDVILRVHPEVAKILKSHHNRHLEEIEEVLGKPVMVKGDPTLHQEKFDLA